MKLNQDFALRQIAGMWALIPTGETLKSFRGLLKLNQVGADLWRGLEEGKTSEQLSAALVDTYGITKEQADTDVAAFFVKLKDNGCILD